MADIPQQQEGKSISNALRRDIVDATEALLRWHKGAKWMSRLTHPSVFVNRFQFAQKFYKMADRINNRDLDIVIREIVTELTTQEFLTLLREAIHPDIRRYQDSIDELRDCFNEYLEPAGYKIVPIEKDDSGRYICKARRTAMQPRASQEAKEAINQLQVKECIDVAEEEYDNKNMIAQSEKLVMH